MEKQFIAESLNTFIDVADIGKLMTQRMQKMKETVQRLNDAGLRKTLLYPNMAASLKTTVGEPENIRRSKALVYHLEHIDMPIYDGEQLIGSITGMWPVDKDRHPTYEELTSEIIEVLDDYFKNCKAKNKDDYDEAMRGYEGGLSFEENAARTRLRFGSLMARDHYDANIHYQDMQKLIKDMDDRYSGLFYPDAGEIGSVIENHFVYDYGEETRLLLRANGWNAANHTNLNYKAVVRRGFADIINEIEDRFNRAGTREKKDFFESCAIVMKGAGAFIKRYAEAARKTAGNEKNAERKEELIAMARVMDKIATEKPDTFTEAIVLVWMTHLIGNLFGGSALSFARFDQYMFPFYKKDIENGTITVERVRELLCSLYLKMNEPKMRTVQSLCVGGVKTEDGSDAANDLTKLCLETMSMLKMPYPNMSVRIDPLKTPDWLYIEAVRTVKAGCGQPMILNDSVWIPNLASLGMPVEWARDYYNMGCTEIMIQGKDSNWITGGMLLFPEILIRLLRRVKNENIEFNDFDQFMEEYLKMLASDIKKAGENGNKVVRAQREMNCDPFASVLIDGCLESETDYFKGGSANGDPVSILAQGLGTVADSLSVIKKFVFDEKMITLAQLYELCISDFSGNELLRRRFSNYAPAYGNDDDFVDEIAKKVFDTYSCEVRELNKQCEPKTRFVNNVFSYNLHIALGESLCATPNGRRSGETVSDCAGPTQGRDTCGPTAFMNSLLKLCPNNVTGAHALNMKISPSLVKDEEGTRALINLIRVYLKEKGPQIQINYVGIQDLEEAQKEPGKHRDLIVRIAGYCEYFVNLDYKLQNEIIQRTLHEIE